MMITRRRIGQHRQHAITLREALDDPQLLGNALPGKSWKPWRALLIAAMGELLTDDERAIFKQLTGRNHEPGQRCEELVGVIGRRGGKSRAISVLAAYVAGLCQHPSLVSGETGIVLVIAPDQKQSTIVLDYCEAVFRSSPILRQLIKQRTGDALQLNNGISIEVRSANFRRLRGPTYIAIIADEVAFWYADETSANPDSEILNAVRPGLATTNGLLVLISSPYARKGELFQAFDKHFGKTDDPILVARAPSRVMNSSLRQSVVDRAFERDPASAAAEFGGRAGDLLGGPEFRTDLEAYVSLDRVRACIRDGVLEVPYRRGETYYAFIDPSGGAGDSFTLAIACVDGAKQTLQLTCLREKRPPFSPEAVCEEFAAVMRSYSTFTAQSDRFGGAWVTEMFAHFGITVEQSAKAKSQLYTDLLPLINSARVELLDHPRLIQQLVGLERRTARSGRDTIDHAPGGHDDIVNAVAGAAQCIIELGVSADWTAAYGEPQTADAAAEASKSWRAARLRSFLVACGMPPL
jgi:hypothetical protein